MFFFFFSSRRRHTRSLCDWSSDVCSSDLRRNRRGGIQRESGPGTCPVSRFTRPQRQSVIFQGLHRISVDRKSTRLNSSHTVISYAVFCLKKKKTQTKKTTNRNHTAVRNMA